MEKGAGHLKVVLVRHSRTPVRAMNLGDAVSQLLLGHVVQIGIAQLVVGGGKGKLEVRLKGSLIFEPEICTPLGQLVAADGLLLLLGKALLRVHPAGQIEACNIIVGGQKGAGP
ncbi:hypothetical protein D3C81_1838810 [compost metagenome]